MEHAELPWRHKSGPRLHGIYHLVMGQDGKVIAEASGDGPDEEDSVNVAYIVQACNAYPELVKALTGAHHALRSYQYGNASTELAQGQADHIDSLLKRVASFLPPAPTCDDFVGGRTDSEST